MDFEPPGTYGMCPVCEWIDRPLDTEPDRIALQRARVNYVEHGQTGRAPRPGEARDVSWTASDEAVRRRDAARDAVVRQIREAFGAVTAEGRISLRRAFRDDMGDAPLPSDWDDRDTRWTEIPDEVLEAYSSIVSGGIVFSFGNAAGYRYYLPAYMLYELKTAPAIVLGALRQRTTLAGFDHVDRIKTFDALDQSQRAAVRAFLRYLAEFASYEGDAVEASAILEEHWPDDISG